MKYLVRSLETESRMMDARDWRKGSSGSFMDIEFQFGKMRRNRLE